MIKINKKITKECLKCFLFYFASFLLFFSRYKHIFILLVIRMYNKNKLLFIRIHISIHNIEY